MIGIWESTFSWLYVASAYLHFLKLIKVIAVWLLLRLIFTNKMECGILRCWFWHKLTQEFQSLSDRLSDIRKNLPLFLQKSFSSFLPSTFPIDLHVFAFRLAFKTIILQELFMKLSGLRQCTLLLLFLSGGPLLWDWQPSDQKLFALIVSCAV